MLSPSSPSSSSLSLLFIDAFVSLFVFFLPPPSPHTESTLQDHKLDNHTNITAMQMQLLGMSVELPDIEKAVNPKARVDFNALTKGDLDEYKQLHSHCSALVKVTDDLSELYASHNTWCSYSNMLRIFKTYKFAGMGAAETVRTGIGNDYPTSIQFARGHKRCPLLGSNLLAIHFTLMCATLITRRTR